MNEDELQEEGEEVRELELEEELKLKLLGEEGKAKEGELGGRVWQILKRL